MNRNLRGKIFVVSRFTEAHSFGKGGVERPILHAIACFCISGFGLRSEQKIERRRTLAQVVRALKRAGFCQACSQSPCQIGDVVAKQHAGQHIFRRTGW